MGEVNDIPLIFTGVITFAGRAKLSIALNTANSLVTFRNALLQLQSPTYTDGADNVQSALDVARNQAFTEANGGRKDVQKLLIYITGGFNPAIDLQVSLM